MMSLRLVPVLSALGFTSLNNIGVDPESNESITGGTALDDPRIALERALRKIPVDFDRLPILFEGHSKSVRLWTDQTVVISFKPTIYSYTMNRYGEVPGTDSIRLRFTASLFRKMSSLAPRNGTSLRSAFLAEIDSQHGPLLVQKLVTTCNIETRVKRYHIGSPLHRYLYTEKYHSTQTKGPLGRWSRFEEPVVCFDWRHPLRDLHGNRLADEPLSDDYAGVWMHNIPYAKALARETFLWMEGLFERAGLRLIDLCLFIDREGQTIYGEISPDCMRVRIGLGDPSKADSADKDLWRDGHTPGMIRSRYQELYERLFGKTI